MPLSNYNNVIEFLKSTFLISQNRIQCNPVKKVVSDSMVVGIVTSSNQFVPVIPEKPKDQTMDELPIEETFFSPHELLVDDIIMKTKTDVERN